jgi:ketosteroid isomerase-like protein
MKPTLIDRVRAYHDAMNRFDLEAAAGMFSDDAEYHSPSVGAVYGRYALLQSFRGYFDEYPDQVALDDLLEYAGPDSVRSLWRLTATSRSTGRKIDRKGEAVMFFNAKGQIRRIEVTG